MGLLWSLIYIAVLGIASHVIGELLPRRWFDENRFPYKLYKWERNGKFYNRFKIKKWKSKLPDMSKVMKDMVPKKLSMDDSADSVDTLIKETCVAECVHLVLFFLYFAICFIWPTWLGAVFAFLAALTNIPYVMIQRYNRPHFMEIRRIKQAREGAV